MTNLTDKLFGFRDGKEYVESSVYNQEDRVLSYPKMLKRRVFYCKSVEAMKDDAKEVQGIELKRTLGTFDLTAMGVGFMCGAGIFVSPGYIAHSITGPALFIAYLIAALSAFLSSFCYAEFTVNIPLAGAAYNYVYTTLGECIAWVTVSNLILEYILANAAAARGFAPYLARLFNKPSNFFIYNWNGYAIDGWSCGMTLFCTCILAFGIKESTQTKNIITAFHVVIMIFIIITGLTKANADNFKPFVKKGASWKSVFNGAAIAFFSFIGFDAMATTAEEVKEPEKTMPRGILGSVSIVTLIYVMMCITLSLMVPNDDIDEDGTFAAAFDYVGYPWAKYIVSIGALMGIFTTTLIGVLGGARILVGCCRERMLPPGLAMVGKRQTPWVATWIIGLCSGGIALFSDFAELANMISIGTFLVFYVVAVALLWFRSYAPGITSFKRQCLAVLHIFAIVGFSLGFTLVWTLPNYEDATPGYMNDYVDPPDYVPEYPAGKWNNNQYIWLIVMGACVIISIFSMSFFVRQDYIPPTYRVPLFPFIPAGSIFVNTFLLGQLDIKSYTRFAWWTVSVFAIYLVYGAIAQEAQARRARKLQTHESMAEDGISSEAGAFGQPKVVASPDTSSQGSPLK